METIRLIDIKKYKNCFQYEFDITAGLKKYFSNKPFVIEYPVHIEQVPNSIAAVPFVCNVLPIIWLTDSTLELKELDLAFYNSIPQFKKGYITMFPETDFRGTISVEKLVECDLPNDDKCAAFFSGGLDAVNTLVMHMDEKPALISIWGADIKYDNVDGWDVMHSGISELAKQYDLPDVVIRSSFREFDNESALHAEFYTQLKDGWWHGVKHGIGLLGHAAPYAYLKKLSTVYIASSNCPLDGIVRCASHPSIDNMVRFGNSIVVHDGYEFSRQDKARNVVSYANKTGEKLPLHVCWETQTGGNCCSCEKCYRTMSALIAEGADPIDYGFQKAKDTIDQMQTYLIEKKHLSPFFSVTQWTHISKRMRINKKALKQNPYWSHIKWVIKADFLHPENLRMPPKTVREWFSQRKFYQKLHDLRVKLHHE